MLTRPQFYRRVFLLISLMLSYVVEFCLYFVNVFFSFLDFLYFFIALPYPVLLSRKCCTLSPDCWDPVPTWWRASLLMLICRMHTSRKPFLVTLRQPRRRSCHCLSYRSFVRWSTFPCRATRCQGCPWTCAATKVSSFGPCLAVVPWIWQGSIFGGLGLSIK